MTNDLAQMVKDIALSNAQATMGGYEAGREAGFREGIKKAAELVERKMFIVDNRWCIEASLLREIRGLRP